MLDSFDLRDTAGVAIAGEGSFKPDANDLNSQGCKDCALADGEHVGIVVFASPAGGLFVPAKRATDSFDLVGDHGFAVARPPEDNAAFEIVIGDSQCDGANKEWIIDWIGAVRTEVTDFVPPSGKERLEHFFVVKACVVGPDGNVHTRGFRERPTSLRAMLRLREGIVNSDFGEIFCGVEPYSLGRGWGGSRKVICGIATANPR